MRNFLVICILFSSLSLYSQSVKIIKDSVCIDGKYYELQELTITKQRCFFTIQRAFDIFDGARFQDYEYRLYYKKKTVLECGSMSRLECGSFECLQKIGYAFEEYMINYEKNGILNLEIWVTGVGCPRSSVQFFTFDLNEDKNLGEDVFIYKDLLLKKYIRKLKAEFTEEGDEYDEDDEKIIDLSQYKIETDTAGNIQKFVFYYDYLRMYLFAEFSFEEIKPFLKPEFLRRLSDE